MNVIGESDMAILPKKQPNKGGNTPAEVAEGRALTKGNGQQTAASWTQSHASASPGLLAVRKAAQKDKGVRFTALMHHVTVDLLRQSYYSIKRDSAPGVDGVTWGSYGTNLEEGLRALHERVHRGVYRARPGRRVYIQKADGTPRPLSILSVEDKIVQQAIVFVLNAIYETEFLGFSYGFRSGRGQHDALDALQVGLFRRKVSWVFDADIQGFFDAVNHDWMMRFLKHRIGDRRILRLIAKWLRVGTIEDGCRNPGVKGVPQGAVISPLLANIYLHYVFDLWSNKWRKRATGDTIIIRYADDTIVGFQHREEAMRFYQELTERMCQFGLILHPEKTRILRFGRYASDHCKKEGRRKPETFDFLGFTHYCTKARRNGKYVVGRKSVKKRMRTKLMAIKQELRKRLHAPISETGGWLNTVLRGHLNYFAVPGNGRSLNYFFKRVALCWMRSLRRRSQKSRMNWVRFKKILMNYFPAIRILHPQPMHRFDAITRGRSPVR